MNLFGLVPLQIHTVACHANIKAVILASNTRHVGYLILLATLSHWRVACFETGVMPCVTTNGMGTTNVLVTTPLGTAVDTPH